jgi:serine/threonine protein phosphatase PrpC
MRQLTTDHSHVQSLIASGRITPDQARSHPLRNVITRALGADDVVEADFHVLPEDDCRLLLCSDGLSGEVADGRIREILMAAPDPTDAAVGLLDEVLEGPARDNVTVIVVDIRFPNAEAEDGSQSTGAVPLVVDTTDTTAELAGATETDQKTDAATDADTDEMGRPGGGHPISSHDAAAWDESNSSVTSGTDPHEE